jgi:hypothetical protein
MFKKFTVATLLAVSGSMLYSTAVLANDDGDYSVVNRPYDFFTDPANGWNMFADDDSHIGPGGGGQRFDAEYLFYKYDESSQNLTIGLQTGFDVNDGYYNGYYAGDLALSFDGSTSGAFYGYEYAVDFGLVTKNYNGDYVNDGYNNDGQDTAGLYSVSQWDNNILNPVSSPFAMDEGSMVAALSQNSSAPYSFTDGVNNSGIDSSFYRIVSFDLAGIVDVSSDFTVDAHWTMSCGNDAINGSFTVAQTGGGTPVPEPSILALFGIGSLGVAFTGMRRRKQQS